MRKFSVGFVASVAAILSSSVTLAAEKPSAVDSLLAQNPQTRLVQVLAQNAPTKPPREAELLEKLQRLEQKQQQLEQEINALRQQLVTPKPDAVGVTAPEKRPQQIEVSAEALFLQPRTSNAMDFAIADPGTALAVSGELASVRYDDQAALRVGLAYRPANTAWEVAATHTFFNTEGQQSAVRPANGLLFSTLTHPFQNDSADTADASAKLDYRATDLELAYRFNVGQGLGIRLFSGLRFSDVNQSMNVAYNGRDFNNGTARSSYEFSGFGPRMGAQANLRLSNDLKLFGRGAGLLMLGTRSTSYEETNNNGADVVARLSQDRYQKMVPGLEFAIGLSWQPKISQKAALNFSIGYEYQHLFNVSNSIRFVDAQSPGVFTESQNDLSLQGLFLQVGLFSEF